MISVLFSSEENRLERAETHDHTCVVPSRVIRVDFDIGFLPFSLLFFYRTGGLMIALLQSFLLLPDQQSPSDRLVGEQDGSVGFAYQLAQNVRFPCPNCNSVFNRKNNLQKHLKYECGQLPRFKCPYCEYRSKKTSNIRAHVRSIHFGLIIHVIDLNASHD